MCSVTACLFWPDINLKEDAITVWIRKNIKLILASSITLFCKISRYWQVRDIGQQQVLMSTALLDAFPKLRKVPISFCISACLPVLLLPAWNHSASTGRIFAIFDCVSKICREKSSFIKILQEWRVIYMENNTRF